MDIATLLRLNSGQVANGATASAPVREHILVSHTRFSLMQSVVSANHTRQRFCPGQLGRNITSSSFLVSTIALIMQVAIVWELNRLRHSLMLTVLAWANSLHDPATYSRSYSGPPSTTSKSGISALIGAHTSGRSDKLLLASLSVTWWFLYFDVSRPNACGVDCHRAVAMQRILQQLTWLRKRQRQRSQGRAELPAATAGQR
jgi:hypothetical protein